ncbi:ester cyclase [Aeromicrobium yanjiei]|uniref:SnoaL-like domain-containing protein n=1 Tax=Aeromicrobium yanjiei TaxID=2662028 RepID=A0A5Q2MKU4_9ACTN|nr:ester cyclase [Aeromicrobium yanjiei]QGG40570.1 hypothetical protein GEV26_03880 [Aeromicrobium yanjiei]
MNRPSDPLLQEIALINAADCTTAEGLGQMVDQICALFTDDVQMSDLTTTDTVKGQAQMREYCTGYFGALTNMQIEVTGIFDSENTSTMFLTITGDHTGELLGIEPTGRRISYPAIVVMQLNEDNSKMRHETMGYDTGLILQQLT